MCFINVYILLFCLILLQCYALNCRTNGGPTEYELKNIFNKCLKLQNNSNSTNNKNVELYSKESRRYNKNDRDEGRDENRNNNRNNWISSTDRTSSSDNWMSNSYSKINNNNQYSNDGMSSRYDGRSNEGKMSNRNDGSGSRYDRVSNYDRNSNRNDGMGHEDRISNRNDYYGSHDERGRDDHLKGRDDFQNDDTNMYQYNGYRSSTQGPHRYKRERDVENTGQRSQYNPYTQRSFGYDENNSNDEANPSENNTRNADNVACALNCFLEKLQMTAEDGMPDKYLVTHEITKDVKNEDLRDFLEESIEECFQILGNENTEDKCEFSKLLLLCLSEKGKANCDDWKDDIRL